MNNLTFLPNFFTESQMGVKKIDNGYYFFGVFCSLALICGHLLESWSVCLSCHELPLNLWAQSQMFGQQCLSKASKNDYVHNCSIVHLYLKPPICGCCSLPSCPLNSTWSALKMRAAVYSEVHMVCSLMQTVIFSVNGTLAVENVF